LGRIHFFLFLYFLWMGPEWHWVGLFCFNTVINVGRWLYSEINPLCDERPRCILYFLLIYNSLDASDGLWDSIWYANTRAFPSILVLLRFFDSLVNRLAEIRAGGVVGDWDLVSPIRQDHKHHLPSGSCSMMSDQRYIRWTTMNAFIDYYALLRFGTKP
jgi:hypothetical protein